MKIGLVKLVKGSVLLFIVNILLIGIVLLGALTKFTESKVYSSFDMWTLLHSRFAYDFFWFISSLLLISVVLAALAFMIWRHTALPWIKKEDKGYYLILVLFMLQLLLWNNYLFPGSVFSRYGDSIAFFLVFIGVSIVTLTLFFGGGLSRVKHLTIILLLTALTVGFFNTDLSPLEKRHSDSPPDIIIVGIDSLRPEFASPEIMPALHSFLADTVVYQNAYTPLARTYPAWMSILSGVYPTRHGARFNLIPRSRHNPDYRLLTTVLGDAGYESLHASDEKRFANIDRFHGFNYIAGARIGVSDFVLGAISDSPFINLTRQLPLSRYLFPFIYSNRAAYAAYLGHDFVDEVERGMMSLNPEKPSLIAIHLCRPHWPYEKIENGDESQTWYQPSILDDFSLQRYLKSLNTVDRQFEQIMATLKKAGRLDNVILFVVSDHGETFQSDAVMFSPRVKGDPPYIMESFGHGTSAEHASQYKVLLSMKSFKSGKPTSVSRTVSTPVSLLDIYPTVLDFVGLPFDSKKDGVSLTRDQLPLKRDFFVETGFNVPAIMQVTPNMQAVFTEGVSYYHIEKNGYVVIKESKIQNLIEAKDLSVFRGNEVVVYKPKPSEGTQHWLWFDFTEKLWQPLDDGRNLSADVLSMVASLCNQYNDHDALQKNPLCRLALSSHRQLAYHSRKD